MSRRKKHAAPENHERWLVSYADFITLLFAFFVVMFASSQTDKNKAKQMSESVKKALSESQVASAIAGILGGVADDKGKGNAQMRGPGGAAKLTADVKKEGQHVELMPVLEVLTKELEKEIKSGKMQVTMESRGLVVSFRQAAFFPSGGDDVAPETLGTVEKVALTISKLPNPVRLEGHTDSRPIRNARFRSNWELSAARGITLMHMLVDRYGLPSERFSVAGYAENAPVDSNDTEEGRQRNRRVDIVILNHTGMRAEPTAAAGNSTVQGTPRGH